MKSNKQLKIVLALSAFMDSIGGPVSYADGLKKHLQGKALVKIVSYNMLGKRPKGIRRLLFLVRLFRASFGADIIYGFNLVSSGLPACFISWLLRKRLVVRLGGDFLWERAVEKGKTKETMQRYYHLKKTRKEKFWLYLQKQVLCHTHQLIFTTRFQKELYQAVFHLKLEKAVVIENPFIKISNFQFPISKQFPIFNFQLLYAGRFLKLKSLEMLLMAFSDVLETTDKPIRLKIIGKGNQEENLKLKIKNLKLEGRVVINEPLSRESLHKEIQQSYLCVLPSLSEISPNFALECIALRKPILLTKENGLNKAINEKLLLIDPKNQKDLEQKILYLLDEKNYQDYLSKIKQIDTSYSFEQVAKKHILLFNTIVYS